MHFQPSLIWSQDVNILGGGERYRPCRVLREREDTQEGKEGKKARRLYMRFSACDGIHHHPRYMAGIGIGKKGGRSLQNKFFIILKSLTSFFV